MAESIWVGKDEHEGVLAQPRKDLKPPAHWRLEAVAHTPRPRSLDVVGGQAVFIEDGGDTSDLFLLDLDAGGPPRRLTTGREPMPYWEDTQPRLSPDGTRVAYGDGPQIWIVPTAGGSPRRVVEGASPLWVDNGRLLIAVERDDTTRLALVDADDAWPRRLAVHHGELEPHGDEGEPAVAPGRSQVAYTFTPRADLNRSEIRVANLDTGAVRALTGTPRMHDANPVWSPDGATVAYLSERSGFVELHLAGAEDRQLTRAGADHSDPQWHPDGAHLLAVRNRRNRFEVVAVDAQTGEAQSLAGGGTWSRPHWTPAGAVVGEYSDHATAPELSIVASGAAAESAPARSSRDARRAPLHAPAPLAIRAAPHATLEDVAFTSFDGLEIPAFLMRPRTSGPVPAVVHPHGGPTDAFIDDWDGHAQYFVEKGYAWLAVNFRGSTGYGRDFERRNHDVWGVDDTKDCLAAADYLRGLDWIDGNRLGIFGGSYGAYMALMAVTDDPEHRFRCAITKYGDCDIVTSWAQGDRDGVQDLERMMGPPSSNRDAYRAGSAYHRLEHLRAPLLIAHGERDERVSPKQSEQLVARLRQLGKTFEYVTYPTEAHGFLRAGPQLDFYRRMERFLDWHLM